MSDAIIITEITCNISDYFLISEGITKLIKNILI